MVALRVRSTRKNKPSKHGHLSLHVEIVRSIYNAIYHNVLQPSRREKHGLYMSQLRCWIHSIVRRSCSIKLITSGFAVIDKGKASVNNLVPGST